MSKNGKFAKPSPAGKPNSKLIIGLVCAAVFLILLIIALIIFRPQPVPPVETTAPIETTTIPTTEAPTTVPETTAPTEPKEMLDWMVEYYQKNPDIAGWIKIEGTKLDEPVMHVYGDNEKYLYKNFEGNFSPEGLVYIKGSCSLDPESTNLVIYGHNMLDGTMFGDLKNYANENYWKEHPIITFCTLYEEREYEIVAAFYDRIYSNSEDVFKFYDFIDARDEEHFNEAIAYYKEHAEYETGVTAEYGDHLITLVTCSYHTQYGRFVVVAREIVEEPAAEGNSAE